MAVVGRLVAVDGDTNLDPEFREELTEPLVQLHTVRMNPQVQLTDAVESRTKFGDDPAHPVYAGQQGFSPMKDDLHGADSMPGRMLGDALGAVPHYFVRYDLRPAEPALVGSFIHIAVITGEVTSATYLQHELMQRHERVPHAGRSSFKWQS